MFKKLRLLLYYSQTLQFQIYPVFLRDSHRRFKSAGIIAGYNRRMYPSHHFLFVTDFLNKIGLFQRLSENTSLPTAELVLSETHITAKWHALPDTSPTQRKCTIAFLQILVHHNYICIMSTNLDKTWLVGTSPWLITTASPKALYANDGLMHFETWF